MTPSPPEVKGKFTVDTDLLWVGGSVEEGFPCYYKGLAEYTTRVMFSGDDETYQDLRYYIGGVALGHPNWRVAVIGAMYEDEIMQVANAIQESSLETTVLTRYCVSCTGFINLDELMNFVLNCANGEC